jgi:hypothetical protein
MGVSTIGIPYVFLCFNELNQYFIFNLFNEIHHLFTKYVVLHLFAYVKYINLIWNIDSPTCLLLIYYLAKTLHRMQTYSAMTQAMFT